MQAANPRAQRAANRSLILSELRSHRLASRVDLSRSTGLEKSSITNIVSDLLEAGLLAEQERGRSATSGGRRAVSLRINERFCSFLGIEIQPRRYRAALLDLTGAQIFRDQGEVHAERDGLGATLQNVYQRLSPGVDRLRVPVAGLGIGVPGYVNPVTGAISRSIPLGLEHVEFLPPPNPWGVQAWMENDAKCCAWAQLIEPAVGAPRNLLALLMEFQEANPILGQGAGVSTGFGVVIEDRVYYSNRFASGDFKSLFWRAGHKGQVGILDDRLATIRADEAVYASYLEEILLHFSPLASVLDPDRIVLCGDAAPSTDRLHAMLQGPLAGTWISQPENARRIHVSRFGELGVAVGAAGRLLVSLFQPGPTPLVDWETLLAARGAVR
ncbi:MAG TPA: hypothetical protein VFH83_10985 [Spirochaetia bacterium]|nr:hypothetical protein [Spirochaetia bacterium]